MNTKSLSVSNIDKLLSNTGDMALKRRAREILIGLNIKEGERILDLGCGDGYYLHILSNTKIKLSLVGSDFDPPALEAAKRNLKGKKIPLHFGDLMKKLPFKDNYFDKIVMSEVAEHLPDDIKCLKEVRRVLKPGGILCLTVPNHKYPFLWDPINWTLEHLTGKHIANGFFAGLWNKHIRLYTISQLNRVLSRSGFKTLEIKALTVWSLPFNHNIVHLGARLLHSGKLSKENASSINKFETKKVNRPWYVRMYFFTVNTVDKLNDIFPNRTETGVGIFAKATK